MALRFADRLLTIVVTATLTSAAWVVAGSGLSLGNLPAIRPAPSSAPPAHRVPVANTPPQGTGELAIPVQGIDPRQISDTFNDARDEGERVHEALDIMAPTGTPVVAAAAGTVEKLFLSASGGNTIYVRSQDRTTIYYYAHLEAYRPGLVEGATVAKGEQLGTVGSTGNADPAAPHLHFAVMHTTPDAQWWDPASAINPYPLLTQRAQ